MTMALTFYNSLTRKQETFRPLNSDEVTLYTCGPTVYDFAHIGNFRAYVFEDLLRRTLLFSGYSVRQVMNLTDVDDKTIRGSQRTGIPLAEYTQKYKDAFFADLETLRIQPAEHYPAATDHIDDMIALVKTLVDKGYAYVADDGAVYFSIAKYPNYGQLVNIDPAQLKPGERVSQDEYEKESVADFALWKAHSPDDGDICWDSPWGPGRPGWHIECSAMSMRYLGRTFDIHTGGIDNKFPHHEDEIAQSEAANGCTFVNYWLHCAHLIVDGQKMAKSLGNFYTLRDVLEKGYSGREVRWVLLGTHYRQQLNFSFQACADARAALQRTDDFVRSLKEAEHGSDSNNGEIPKIVAEAEQAFREGLEDDLNISATLAALFDLVRKSNKLLSAGTVGGADAARILEQLRAFDTVLGVLDIDREEDVPEDIRQKVEERQKARKNRDFARADSIRDSLKAEGWVVEDTPSGPRIKRAED